MQLKHQNERLQGDIEKLVIDHQHLIQRQTKDGSENNRRLETMLIEINVLRKQQYKEDHILQQAEEVVKYREKYFTLEYKIVRSIEEREALESEMRRSQEMYEDL
jgi:hypothetical protein